MTDYNFQHDELVAIVPKYNKYIGITWQVSDFCNYKCHYCNPGNWAGANKNISNFELIKINMKKIIDYYQSKGYSAFKFYFSGGEPTVWEHLIPLINWLKKEIDDPHIGINTNLSRATSWWEEHYHLFHDVVASFHMEFANVERFTKNMEFLQDKVNYLCSRMMMDEQRFQEVIEYGNFLKANLQNYNIEWVPLWDDISTEVGPWEYKEAWMIDFFKENTFESQQLLPKPAGSKWRMVSEEVYDSGNRRILNGNRIVAERRNFFSGWECNVGESLFIDSRGSIRAASCGQGPNLGNIYRRIDLSGDTVICGKEQCTCGTDILITKKKKHHTDIIASSNG